MAEWCEEWSVKVNAEKCGVMYMRRKGVKRSDERFRVGGEEIKVVEEYKYLEKRYKSSARQPCVFHATM